MTHGVAHPTTEAGRRVDTVLEIIGTVLGRRDLGPDDDVMDRGGTSLALVRILVEAGRALGADVNPRELAGIVTARSIATAAAGTLEDRT